MQRFRDVERCRDREMCRDLEMLRFRDVEIERYVEIQKGRDLEMQRDVEIERFRVQGLCSDVEKCSDVVWCRNEDMQRNVVIQKCRGVEIHLIQYQTQLSAHIRMYRFFFLITLNLLSCHPLIICSLFSCLCFQENLSECGSYRLFVCISGFSALSTCM